MLTMLRIFYGMSTRQDVNKSIRNICCAVDLLATQRICWRFAVETVIQQVFSKSPAKPRNVAGA
jgi:hypothetical protein